MLKLGRGSIKTGAIIALVGVLISLGLGYGLYQLNLRNWNEGTVQNARVLSDTVQSWLEDTYSDLSALAALVENSNDVDANEFENAVDGIESRRIVHFMSEKAILEKEGAKWGVKFSSAKNSPHLPDEGHEVWIRSDLGLAVQRATERPNEWILSKPVKRANGPTILFCVLALNSRQTITLVGVIEIEKLLKAVMDVRAAEGIFPTIFVDANDGLPPLPAFSAAIPSAAIAKVEFRQRTGNVDIISETSFTEDFRGGRQAGLATIVTMAGFAITGLLVVMVVYLREQTSTVERLVNKATADLSTERSLLRSLIDSIPDIISVKDRSGNYLLVNRAYSNFVRRPAETIIGQNMSDVMEPELAKRFHAQDLQVMDSGELYATEDRFQGASGEENFYDTAKLPFRGANGELIGIISVGRNITERKHAEASLKTYKFTLDHAADGILLIDVAGTVTYANENMCLLVGCSEAEIVGENLAKFFPETAEIGWGSRWDAIKRTVRPEPFERVLKRNNGSEIPCEISSRFMKFGNTEFVCSFVRDISERKQAESELRRVHYALEHASDGVIWVDANGQVIEANVAFGEMAGIPRDEVFGRFIGELLEGINGDNWPEIWETVSTRSKDISSEQIVKRADGAVMPVETVSKFIAFGGEQFICTFMRDITKRKQVEEQILRAKEAAEAATNAKSSFLAMMSHEIRTPMNGIMSMAEMLTSTPLNDDQREITKVIQSSADALLTIINDILDFSKIEAGKLDIESVPFELHTNVEAAGELLAQRAYEKGLRLYMEVDPSIPAKVKGDSNRLRQIILNLAGNAIKFTEKGHVALTVNMVSSKMAGAEVRLRFEVADTGIGLTVEQVGRLFQPFQQADVSTSRKFGGTGLGLSISKRLVEMMGGEIGVTSEFGQGSTFWFEIPFAVADPVILRPPAQLEDIGVVVIGFDDTGFGIINRYLRFAGISTLQQASYMDFEKTFATLPPGLQSVVALILVRDSVLAVEAMSRLSAMRFPGLKTLVATPRSMISTIGHVRSQGADGVLPLPLPRQTLWRSIAIVTGRLASESGLEIRSTMDAEWAPPPIEEARAANALILVAEDNKTNQHVIKRILNRLGYAHEIANDGLEALSMYKAGRYGVILSDYHMPNMDGFGLTTAIRELEASSGGHIPIVALTADAMASTEKQCLEAGMDGFLTKPIKVEALRSMLEKWLPQASPLKRHPAPQGAAAAAPASKAASESSGPATPPAAVPGSGIDPDIFDIKRLEETFGSFGEDARRFLGSFVGDALTMIEAVEAALANGDKKKARDEVHALKGASRSMGVNRVGNVAADIQSCLDGNDLETATILVPAMHGAYEEFKSAVSALIET